MIAMHSKFGPAFDWLAMIALAPSLTITAAAPTKLACCAVRMAARFALWS